MVAVVAPHRHRVNINEWHKMSAVFKPEQHLELLNGEITEMSPIGHKHSGHLNGLVYFFRKQLSDETVLSVQNPLQLNNFSEPEPDLMLLKPTADFYKHRHPNAGDVLLLVEISDSSLFFDRNEKLKLYAQHNISDYWIVNLNDQCLEVYRQPKGEDYQQQQTLSAGDSIRPLQFADINLQISDIF
ncbi:MAG: Uma2 family endonuclease [Methylococcaceae bacterium]|nr:Uma2 family endonuclease [Methylococcaceae bacterium]